MYGVEAVHASILMIFFVELDKRSGCDFCSERLVRYL
jgi:hypothetical protein